MTGLNGCSSVLFVLFLQDPKEADPMMRVQNDLDDTKIVLVSCRSPIGWLW